MRHSLRTSNSSKAVGNFFTSTQHSKMPKSMSSKSKSKSASKSLGGNRAKPEPISPEQLQRLLADVEKLNLPRQKVVLADIMMEDKKYYKARKGLVRGFQKKWDLCLRRTPKGYVKLLFQHDVEPSPATQKELEEANKEGVSDTDEDEYHESFAGSSDESDEEDYDTDTETASSKFSVNEIITGMTSLSMGSPTLSSKKKALTKSPMKSPLAKKPDTKKGTGTITDPFIWIVNPEFPEKNGPVTLQFVIKKKLVESFSAHAFMFVGGMPVPDYPLWSLQQVDEYSVLLKKPSQDFWERQSDLYLSKCDCEATKKAFGETKHAISAAGNEHRKLEYHKYIFPDSAPLDNNMFSDPNREDEFEVTKTPSPMSIVPPGMTKSINGVVAMWTVGVKATKSKDGNTKAKTDDLDAFLA